MQRTEALQILQQHQIPFQQVNTRGFYTILSKKQVDPNLLRRLGFRISRNIGDQLIVSYKGWRIGIIA